MNAIQQKIVDRVLAERKRQDDKWGEQNHLTSTWLVIFLEEFGEAAKAVLEQDREQFITELNEAAAVLIAWLECEERNYEA